ncbi:aldehyde dehydrogenase [Ancylobacter sp. 6x-1]|uniref:Aldehyde dehydrogenase n=1 Tax=Ancylobacter crimeensis TaxID=2579147 RepID=A0ABT0DBU7_9HYPH|nr:aldehyde dehydrogenase [Ancylobacter crimeensis]MCK0197436.1 aldehyde dehydrogenase [Ancylobacter crimeensis]
MNIVTATRTPADWQARAAALSIRTEAFIDGRYRPAVEGRSFENVNPATGAKIADIAACTTADVDLAVIAARRSFESGVWSRCDPAERRRVLVRLADLILVHAEELALLETLDMGKLLRDSAMLDIPGSAEVFRWYGEACDKLNGEVVRAGEGAFALIDHEPVGVIGAVVPWNFPLKMAAWKCAPALAAGNSVILKPAEQSPLTALRLAELAAEAGVPDGVFNVLPGFGHEAGQAIGLHAGIDCVAFTGSTEIGKRFLSYAGASNMKRIWLECGGKSANLVFPEAKDLDRAATFAVQGIFFNQGEVCSATSRLFVHRDIAEDFIARVLAKVDAYRPGDPLDAASGMGAMVSEEHTARVMDYIAIGREGATLACGGERVLAETGGCFIAPTVFTGVDPASRLAREEVFGPVLAISTFADEAEVVRLANDSVYGLGASVWTNDLAQAHRVARTLHVGSVSVNTVDAVDVRTPFGGVKQSGSGRDLSLHAFDKYTDLKTTWISL